MGSVYERYLAEQQQGQQTPSTGSLYDQYKSENPQPTAVGNLSQDQQSTQDLIDRLSKVTPANQAHKDRLDRMIQNLKATLPHGPLGAVRGQSDLTNFSQTAEQAVRGASAGVLEGIMQPADVALALPDLAAKHIPILQDHNIFGSARDRIREANAAIEEDINPEGGGGVGALSNFGGNIVSSAPGFGVMSDLAKATILSKLPNSAVANLITRAGQKGAPILTRAAAQIASGLPIQVAVAAGSDGPWQQKLLQLGIGVGADGLFGTLHHGEAEVAAGDVPSTAEPQPSPERQQQLKDMQEKAAAKAAADLQMKVDRRQAKAEWQVANPDKDWNDLSSIDRKGIIKEYQDRRVSNTNLDTSTPVTGEGVGAGASSAPEAGATAPVSGGEVAPSVEPVSDEVAAAHVAANPITASDHTELVDHLNDLVDQHDKAVVNGDEAKATDLSHQAQVVAATLDGSTVVPDPEPTAAEQLAQPSPVAALRDKVAETVRPVQLTDEQLRQSADIHKTLADFKKANPKEIGSIPATDEIQLWMQGDPGLVADNYARNGGMVAMMEHFMAMKRAGVDLPPEFRDEVSGRLMHYDGDPIPSDARPAVQKGWRDAEQEQMPVRTLGEKADKTTQELLLERAKDKTKEDAQDAATEAIASTGILGKEGEAASADLSARAGTPGGAQASAPPSIPATGAVEEPSPSSGASVASDQPSSSVRPNTTGETYLKSIKSKKTLESLSDQQLRLLGKSLSEKLKTAEPEAHPAIRQDIANIKHLLGMPQEGRAPKPKTIVSENAFFSPDEGSFTAANNANGHVPTFEEQKASFEKFAEGINNATRVDTGHFLDDWKAYDLEGDVSPETKAKAVKLSSMKNLYHLWDDAIAHIVDETRQRFTDKIRRPLFGGISLSQHELGLNISSQDVHAFANQFGVKVDLPGSNVILINPFMTFYELSQRAANHGITPDEAALRFGMENWATLTHEVAHQFQGEHDEKFAGAHTRVNAATTDQGLAYAQLFAKEWLKIFNDPEFYSTMDGLLHDWNEANDRRVQAGSGTGTVPGSSPSGSELRQAQRSPSLLERIQSRSAADVHGDSFAGSEDAGAHSSGSDTADEWGLGDSAGHESLDFLDTKTYLDTIKLDKPLEQLNERELDRVENKLFESIGKLKEGSAEYEKVAGDIDKLLENQRWLNVMNGLDSKAKLSNPEVRPVEDAGVSKPTRTLSQINTEQIGREQAEALKPPGLATLRAEPASKLSPDRLNARIDMLSAYTKGLPTDDPMANEYRKVLDKALEERARRTQLVRGVVAQMPPGVFGAAAGFTYGYMSAPDDEDRYTRALEWAAVGAAGGHLLARAAARSGAAEAITPPKDLPGGFPQAEMEKYVTHSDARGAKPIPFLERMRNIYQATIRRSYAMERWQQSIGMGRLPVQFNAAKLIAMAGRWAGQSENALKYGPALVDEFGAIKKLPAMGVADILDMVKGDSKGLGTLMAARTKVELGNSVDTPFSVQQAVQLFNSMPEIYHKAADAARQYSLALADVAVDGGILSKEARDLFANESMYAALQRVFKFDTGAEVSAEKSTSAIAKATNPIKARTGGSQDLVRNPFEVMVQSTPQFFRAAELNKIKVAMVDAWEAAGQPTEFLSRVGKNVMKDSPVHDAQIAELTKLGVSEADAKAMVAGFSPIDDLKGVMRVYRNGDIETYKMPAHVATALQSLNPEDIGMLWRLMGVPSRLAAKGITMNPYFVAKMALFDVWQATLNSQYGFRPGVDNIRGWYHIMKQTPQYQDFMAAGGGHQNLYSSKAGLASTIESVKGSIGNPLENTIANLKQMKPIEAYKSLIAPMADAARMGEYLRALDHGESVLQGVWAARQVTANYSEIGSWATMRGLQHATMFLGPALQVLDQAAYRGGVHPFRAPEEGRAAAVMNYATKGFLTITLPSLYFWAANKDDKQINELRQTQTGRKFWFIRSPFDGAGLKKGDIVKIPKPPLDGQVFGTSLETALDQHYAMDPGGAHEVVQAILRDAAFNILPQAGVVPIGLTSNYDLGQGRPIIPVGDDQLALQYQGADKSSWVARAISSKIAPPLEGSKDDMLRNAVTPAGVDYLINSFGGMLGQDAVQAVSQAVEANQKGFVPAKEELPLVKRVLAAYPSMNTRSVERFYDNSSKVETAATTITHLLREHPEDAMGYYERNAQLIALAPVYARQRQVIANMRRAILDTKNAPPGVISSQDKNNLIKQYTQWINDVAGGTLEGTQQYMPK